MKNLIPKKPDTEDIGIQVGDDGENDSASEDDGASESTNEEIESKPLVVRSARPRLTMVAMETVHITPDRPFSADSHLLPVLSKTETVSKLVSSGISSTADLKSSSITSISEENENQLEENQKEKSSPRKKKPRKPSIRQNSSKDLSNENQNDDRTEVKLAKNELDQTSVYEETEKSNVASITIVHKDSLLKSTSVQTDSYEETAISVTKSSKKVTKKGKLIKKPSSESIKDRLLMKVDSIESIQ